MIGELVMATAFEQTEQKVILNGVGWETYERLLAEHEGSASTRFNYDHGTLEIMVLSAERERLKQTLTTLVELVAAELGIDVDGMGSTTFRKKDAGRGFEADASFYVKHASRVVGKARIDLAVDPPPDLAIEIDITSPSVDKLPIDAALSVPEAWRYDGHSMEILVLRSGSYSETEASEAIKGLTVEVLSELMEASNAMRRSEWVKFVRESVRKGK